MADLGSLLGSLGVGGAIGQAIVRLELDTSKYRVEMAAAEGQTKASANAMGTSTSNFSKFASTALLGVGVAAVAGAAMSVKAATEANDAHLKLQNTFANNKSLSDSSVEAFEAQADSLRDLTGVDDEAIITSQALLGQFDLTGKQVMELTPAIVDLSEKMDIDLQAATKAVGKATAGNAGILSRYGIVLDENALAVDAYGTTLKGLAVTQGFAAKSADQEPWRVLGAQLEEVAESVGQLLLPALQGLVIILTDYLVPALAAVEKGIELAFSSDTYTDIPIIGEIFKALGDGIQHVGFAFKQLEGDSATATDVIHGANDAVSQTEKECREAAAALGYMAGEAGGTTLAIIRFAHMTEKAIKEWATKIKESFDTYVLSLEESQDMQAETAAGFRAATRSMLFDAQDLARAMRVIAKEKWINDEYIQFLSEQGPEWLIGFAAQTEEAQRRSQAAWKRSTELTDSAKDSLDKITGSLKELYGTTKHNVIIEYDYVGFDPSKPGMTGTSAAGNKRP